MLIRRFGLHDGDTGTELFVLQGFERDTVENRESGVGVFAHYSLGALQAHAVGVRAPAPGQKRADNGKKYVSPGNHVAKISNVRVLRKFSWHQYAHNAGSRHAAKL
ncbi:MAG: hypothetical protein HDS72_02405 [Bacteroidales bacterium]|nr:hypothetical protein [Bacteroidales bacterium]